MPLFVRHFWIAFIAATIANAAIFWARSRRHVAADPSLAAGYRKLLWGLLLWGNVPWVIMGLGCLFGGVPSVFHYVRPRDGNPFVLAFFASGLLIMGLGTYWLFSRGGAEMIVRHPGLLNVDLQSPALLKFFWCLCLAGGVVGAISMCVAEVPLPNLGR
jgi:hypothetical protein